MKGQPPVQSLHRRNRLNFSNVSQVHGHGFGPAEEAGLWLAAEQLHRLCLLEAPDLNEEAR
jgi:hypothetical protein